MNKQDKKLLTSAAKTELWSKRFTFKRTKKITNNTITTLDT